MKSLAFVVALLLALTFFTHAQTAKNKDALSPLVQLLVESEDPHFHFDILNGMSDGLKGRRGVMMPAGWEAVAEKLAKSPNTQVRELTQSLSVTFGSASALTILRATLLDANAGAAARSNALTSLLQAKDPQLPEALQNLLSDANMRGGALRGLATYDDAKTPAAILAAYPNLAPAEKHDALTTLSSRLPYAKALLTAVAEKKIDSKELTADIVRQLRSLKDEHLNAQVTSTWGVARETAADKLKDIQRYKQLVARKGYGDARRGRGVFSRTCQQCHTLYGEGGKVAPDLTGSSRADLDYNLQNIIDPNAVIPNDYRTWNVETKDDRSITGIVTKQDANAVTIVTANETIVISRGDVQSLKQTELSLMPDGLLQALSESEVRDLLAYLKTTAQVPLP
ncbi:MAG TPA: c-type cytochrome [Candidatus Acidoferrum sp.]|nr:c-type cytochrome [Candidatus Acidoferrum sp.]